MSETGNYTTLTCQQWDMTIGEAYQIYYKLGYCANIMFKTHGSSSRQERMMFKLQRLFETIRNKQEDLLFKDFPEVVVEKAMPEPPNTIICPKVKPNRLPRMLSDLQKEYIINVLNDTTRILNYWDSIEIRPFIRGFGLYHDNIRNLVNSVNAQIDYITQL